ncbi:MAG: extracellular solute-binding protein [Anaerolineae bacterium]|nr:extracellular solute-binding protein [Anaerolineae bacterium]
MTIIYQNGGSVLDDMQNPTRTTFDDPQTIEALEWYAALIHDYNVAPTRRQVHDIGGSVQAGVNLNKVGMWMGWIDERGGSNDPNANWIVEWKMRWGMVPLPRGKWAATPATTNGYAISANTAHPEECWQWITFLSSQVRTPSDMIPARKSLAESDEYREAVGDNVVNVTQASLDGAVLLSPALMEFVDISIYTRAIDAIVTGSATPQEALTRAQEEAENER